MFRVSTAGGSSHTTVTVDGQLIGDYVDVVEKCCDQALSAGRPVHVFLRDVSMVDQAARAMTEQARAVKDITGASDNVAQQIKLITTANLRHSELAEQVLTGLRMVRTVADTNTTDAGLMHAEEASGAAPRRVAQATPSAIPAAAAPRRRAAKGRSA